MQHSDLVARARAFAIKSHKGQTRSGKAQEPYWKHPQEVARLIEESGGSEEEIAGGWLHDCVEDTKATVEVIRKEFGSTVAAIVQGVTDAPEIGHLPTLERKRIQAEHIRHESNSVKRVKVGDQTSNVRSIGIDPPVAWSKQKCRDYITGAKLIVDECRGLFPFLDAEFDKAFEIASRAHA